MVQFFLLHSVHSTCLHLLVQAESNRIGELLCRKHCKCKIGVTLYNWVGTCSNKIKLALNEDEDDPVTRQAVALVTYCGCRSRSNDRARAAFCSVSGAPVVRAADFPTTWVAVASDCFSTHSLYRVQRWCV